MYNVIQSDIDIIAGSSHHGSVVNKSHYEPWGCGLIPGLAQWVKDMTLPWAVVVGCRLSADPTLLWMWCRPAATAPIRPLALDPLYAVGAALEQTKSAGWISLLHFPEIPRKAHPSALFLSQRLSDPTGQCSPCHSVQTLSSQPISSWPSSSAFRYFCT